MRLARCNSLPMMRARARARRAQLAPMTPSHGNNLSVPLSKSIKCVVIEKQGSACEETRSQRTLLAVAPSGEIRMPQSVDLLCACK